MTGETNLSLLLKNMQPELNPGRFAFCIVNTLKDAIELNPLVIVQEKEAVTVVIPKSKADDSFLYYPVICAWITLNVHSSLEAVGLTAAVSKVLTEAGISCNVIAGYYHDHLFVPTKDAQRAMDALAALTKV